ncbi:MAG: GreA/GreB family elongation factor [Actinomycetota bacterium]|nr:GreA/GreB family elongation factor [Actinomycetota bacterium]
MTATLKKMSVQDVLTMRLASLREAHARTLAEIVPDAAGDAADRATNVDAHVQLASLDERIASIEEELISANRTAPRGAGDTVAITDVVVLDFGDGPETFVLGSVNLAADTHDVVTPDSPLGIALRQAHVGDTISWRTHTGRVLKADVVAVNPS